MQEKQKSVAGAFLNRQKYVSIRTALANAITLLRLIMIPPIIYLIFTGDRFLASAVFGLTALTDLFDGYIARLTGTVTEFGKVIDPLIDRLFILSTVVAIYFAFGRPPLTALVVLAGRDIILLAGYFRLKNAGKELNVIFIGKLATAMLMFSFFLIIWGIGASLVLFYAGLILYLLAGFSYYYQGKKLLSAGG